jgi:hypothetical protein
MPAARHSQVLLIDIKVKTVTNNLQLSPDFTIERGRTARNIKTVTAPGYNLIPEMAAFMAAILEAARLDRPPLRR